MPYVRMMFLTALVTIVVVACSTSSQLESTWPNTHNRQSALDEIVAIRESTEFHQEAIREIESFVHVAVGNFGVLVRASEFAASAGSNTPAFVEIARYASQTSEHQGDFLDLLDRAARSTSGHHAMIAEAKALASE